MADDFKQSMSSDEQLISETLGGDVAAFGTIVERYWNMVVGLAMSKIGEPAEAEDIAQESFMKAYSQLYSLQQPSRVAGWLVFPLPWSLPPDSRRWATPLRRKS